MRTKTIQQIIKMMRRYVSLTSASIQPVKQYHVWTEANNMHVALLFENGKWASTLTHSIDGIIGGFNCDARKLVWRYHYLGEITREEANKFTNWFDELDRKQRKTNQLEELKRSAARLGYSLVEKK